MRKKMSVGQLETLAWQAARLLEHASVTEACESIWARLTFDPFSVPVALNRLRTERNCEQKRAMGERLLAQVHSLIEAQSLEIEILRAARLHTGLARGRLCSYRQMAAEVSQQVSNAIRDMKVTTITKGSPHDPTQPFQALGMLKQGTARSS